METKPENGGQVAGDSKVARERGKAHPAFSIAVALQKAEQLQQKAKRQYVPVTVACGYWGYKPTSSTASRCVATLLSYGLIEDQGQLQEKQLRVSENGDTLLRHPNKSSPEYRALLREAALRPKVHQTIFEKYRADGELPTDDSLLKWALEKEVGISAFALEDYYLKVLRETFTAAEVFTDATMGVKIEEAAAGPQVKDVAERGATPKPAESVANPSQETPSVTPATKPENRNQHLPLLTGEAVLSYPHPMTDEDFEWLLEMLQKFRRKLVVAPVAPQSTSGLRIGDLVQWTSQGVDQFTEPRRVQRLEAGFVFVEGSPGGVPISQVTRVG